MKRLLLSSLFVLTAVAFAAEPVVATVSALLDKPDSFTGKEVKTSGKVERFEQRTSKAGNPYFVFKLVEKDKKVSVYGQGTLEKALKNGSEVQVIGKFLKENKVGNNVFKNEINTTPKGVKVL
ncbi:MAG TPA: hypothetical protein VK934_12695 [Fimbriimonas sp.]|nr:hypothetical protein [Fimbriimonas sp.]